MAPTSAHCCRIAVWEEKQLKVKKKRHKGLGRLGCAMPALPATGKAIASPFQPPRKRLGAWSSILHRRLSKPYLNVWGDQPPFLGSNFQCTRQGSQRLKTKRPTQHRITNTTSLAALPLTWPDRRLVALRALRAPIWGSSNPRCWHHLRWVPKSVNHHVPLKWQSIAAKSPIFRHTQMSYC